MRATTRNVFGVMLATVLIGALVPLASAASTTPAVEPEASPVVSVTPTPPPTPTESPDSSPEPDPTPAPTPDPTATAESTPSPEPTATPSPSPTADASENDGPTMPLTRELPADSVTAITPLRLTVGSYGPQPVFRFPYAPGSRWGASGSHADSDGIHRGAIDFAPLSSSDKRVRAVAAGTVYRVSCSNGWFIGVDHGGGWMSEYYHLTNVQASLVGTWVEAGTYLGNAGQTLPCGGTPGASAHVHLSILNAAVDVPSGKRKYVAVSGIQFDNYTLHDTTGAYNGVWRNLSGNVVLTSRGVRCCLTAASRVGPTATSSSLPDTDGNGIDDYADATDWDTDLDANGRPDIIGFGGAGAYSALGTGTRFTSHRLAVSTFGTSKGWSRSAHPRMVIDVTGDGRPDIVGFGGAGVYVSTGNGGTFAAPRLWVADFGSDAGWRVGRHHRVIADVTGDGLPDVVGFGDAGVYVARNTGSSFAAPALWSRELGSSTAAGGWSANRHPRMVVDVTGDGRADLVGFGAGGVVVARSSGTGFAATQRWISTFGTDKGWTVASHPRSLVDVNDDGRPDIVGFGGAGVYVALNTGSSFGASSRWSASFGASASAGSWRGDRHARTLADVNGDGRPDIVGFGTLGTTVALNRGSSFAAPARWTNDFSSREWTSGWMPRSVTDVNGDGRADIVGFAHDGVHVALSSGSRFGAAAHWAASYGWHGSAGSWRVGSHPRAIVS